MKNKDKKHEIVVKRSADCELITESLTEPRCNNFRMHVVTLPWSITVKSTCVRMRGIKGTKMTRFNLA